MNLSSGILLASIGTAALLAVAALARRPATVPKLAFAAGMIGLALESACALAFTRAPLLPDQLAWLRWRLAATSLLPPAWLLFSLTYARGNFREFVKRWRWPIIGAAVFPALLAAFVLPFYVLARPAALPADPASTFFLAWPGRLIQLVCLISAIAVLMNLERTFRSAVGVMRWRLKYTVIGVAVIFGERVYSHSQTFLSSSIVPSHLLLEALAVTFGGLLVLVGVVRAGFFKVDVYPSHAFLSNSITAVLVGIYLAIVGLLAKLVGHYGQELRTVWQATTVLLLLATLVVVLLSDRTRQAFRVFVSRHFRRPSYDYRQVWTRFTDHTASIVNPDDYARTVVTWIAETCSALSVTLWLVDEPRRRLVFGASTALLDGENARVLPVENVAEIIEQMRQQPAPLNIDRAAEPWAVALRRLSPEHFDVGGHRVGAPLIARGQLVGLLMVGDRVAGRPFSSEDIDLLTCVADQLASAVLNFRLSQRLVESKQLEAFQAMSAFFVHDLKNTASTLSLMLQNLPVHFDNPEFRQDALRAVGKTVDHINDLIQRLGLLRRELEIRPVDTDLNDVVKRAVATLDTPGLPLVKSFGSLPPVRVDPEQFSKVVTNLLLNARDALANGASPRSGRASGQIQVQTAVAGDCAALIVRDDGCGMSPEFVEKQLFKPFQTTKKRGIGIGMFHSRMIVEAHHGRIEVETQPGAGTTVRILLPLAGPPA